MSISYFLHQAREYGATYTVGSLLQGKLRLKLREFPQVLALVEGKKGLEIGGPSPLFGRGGILPLYDKAGAIDNCTYSATTVWANHTSDYRFSELRPPGRHFISEGTELSGLADSSYDFVLSSHMIEHTANPLAALFAWKRVLCAGGTLLLIAPDKERTFDNRRATTTMDHLLADYEAHMAEDDRSHLEEVLRDHNLQRTPGWTRERLRNMLEDNLRTRGLHHHVFDLSLVCRMLEHCGFEVLLARRSLPNHLLAVATRRN